LVSVRGCGVVVNDAFYTLTRKDPDGSASMLPRCRFRGCEGRATEAL
jgi:hypothetical protein